MFNFASFAAAAALLTTPVIAADLIIPTSPEPIYDAAGFDWSGAYIGASIGGQGVRMTPSGQGTLEGTALIGGVFVGANGQSGSFVYGVEADVDYSGFDATMACTNPVWDCNGYLDWQGSVRGRVGFAVDTLLFYGTAGVAFGHAGGSTTSPADVVFPDSSVRIGYTVGAGVEMAFSENWTGRVEYRYTDLGARDMSFDVPYPGVQVSSHTVRAGIAYKF